MPSRMRTYALLVVGFATAVVVADRPSASKNEARMRQLDDAAAYVYKTVGDVKLKLYVVTPADHKATDTRPAIVFFFGGGWTNGSPGQFVHQCQYLASRGMVAVTADYRVKARHGVKVPQCVADAKAAIRYVRANVKKLGVDPDRIASGGGSAGGHLGACVGVVPGLEGESDDSSVSSRSNAMVLFNPVMTLAPAKGLSLEYKAKLEQRREQWGIDPAAISPYHHIKKGQPPVIMFFGTADRLLESAEIFDKAYRDVGNRSELKTWAGQGHGFFNAGRGDNKYFIETMRDADEFLTSLGYLEGEPTIDEFAKSLSGGNRR
jgi:acetyl esterase